MQKSGKMLLRAPHYRIWKGSVTSLESVRRAGIDLSGIAEGEAWIRTTLTSPRILSTQKYPLLLVAIRCYFNLFFYLTSFLFAHFYQCLQMDPNELGKDWGKHRRRVHSSQISKSQIFCPGAEYYLYWAPFKLPVNTDRAGPLYPSFTQNGIFLITRQRVGIVFLPFKIAPSLIIFSRWITIV